MPESYRVMVRHGRSFNEMIQAGEYNWINPLVTEPHFPCTENKHGEEETEILLLRPDAPVTSEEIQRESNRLLLPCAETRAFLALGEQFTNLQRRFQVITLGPRWRDPKDGATVVLCLWGTGPQRYLDLRALDGLWYPAAGYVFAVTANAATS